MMATWLSAITGSRVELAFAAPGRRGSPTRWPRCGDVAARRVVVASYLLSEGLFQDRLVRLIANRFSRARVSNFFAETVFRQRMPECRPAGIQFR